MAGLEQVANLAGKKAISLDALDFRESRTRKQRLTVNELQRTRQVSARYQGGCVLGGGKRGGTHRPNG